METMKMTVKQVRLVALIASVVATTCVVGGSLSLAEHYAQAGVANHNASRSFVGEPSHDMRRNG